MARSPRDPAPKDPGEGETPPPKPRRTTRSTKDPGALEAPPPKPRRRTTRRSPEAAAGAAPAIDATPPEAPAPVTTVAGDPTPPPPPEPAPAAEQPNGRLRGIGAWVITVLAGVAVTAAVIGFWVHQTVLDTDRFMAAVTPAVESEAVQTVVADRLSDEVIESLDLDSRISAAISQASDGLTEALADALGLTSAQVERLARLDIGLQALAAPIAAGVETRIRDAVDRFVTSVAGSDLLLNVVETAHERTVHLLRDELDELPNLVVDEGEVRLNLVPLVAEAVRSVVNAGIGVVGIDRQIPPFESNEDAEQAVERLATLLGRDLRPDFGQVELMSEDQLSNAQDLVQTFDRIVWVLLILAIVLAVLAVVLAPTVTSGLVRVGIAVAVGVVIGWVGIDLITTGLVDAAGTAEGQMAIKELTNAVVATLQPVAAALAIIGIGTAAAAVFAGRGGWTIARGVDEGA